MLFIKGCPTPMQTTLWEHGPWTKWRRSGASRLTRQSLSTVLRGSFFNGWKHRLQNQLCTGKFQFCPLFAVGPRSSCFGDLAYSGSEQLESSSAYRKF